MKRITFFCLTNILAIALISCSTSSNTKEEPNAEVQNIASFKLIGISVRTTNKNSKAMEDLGALWNQFYAENIIAKIPNKFNRDVYTVYTDYESDYQDAYTAIIGCKVKTIDSIPAGMVGKTLQGGNYKKFKVKGDTPKAVVNTWQKIWKDDPILNRKYTADFEVYHEKTDDPGQKEIEIYIAVTTKE